MNRKIIKIKGNEPKDGEKEPKVTNQTERWWKSEPKIINEPKDNKNQKKQTERWWKGAKDGEDQNRKMVKRNRKWQTKPKDDENQNRK